MSILSNIKDLLFGVDKVMGGAYTAKKIARILRVVSALLVLLVLLLNCWNLVGFTYFKPYPLLNEKVRYFINKNILYIFSLWIIYRIIIENIFRRIAVLVETKTTKTIIPVWLTIDDFIDISFAVYFMIYGINLLLEFCNGHDVLNNYEMVYWLFTLYLISIFIEWLYIKNSNIWYCMKREYTEYYDSEGKRIPKDAYVVYYGKRYKVELVRKDIGLNRDNKKHEWRISTKGCLGEVSDISLEEAVKDKEGKLVLDKWKLGQMDELEI